MGLKTWMAGQAEKAEARQARQSQRIIGVAITDDGQVHYRTDKYPLPARATVETAGQLERRVTATRLVATGVFAFALKKKKDDRQLFLTVEGDGWAFVADIDPQWQSQARDVAAQINSWRPAEA